MEVDNSRKTPSEGKEEEEMEACISRRILIRPRQMRGSSIITRWPIEKIWIPIDMEWRLLTAVTFFIERFIVIEGNAWLASQVPNFAVRGR
jgi:hypothetical protein